jgi:diguanylate cyclase (GGDEF)-like protein
MEANWFQRSKEAPLRTALETLRVLTRDLAGQATSVQSTTMQHITPETTETDFLAFEKALDFVARVNAQGQFTYVSEHALTFIGYHREYLQTIALADLVTGQEVIELNRCLDQVRQTGVMQKCTLHLVKSLTYPRLVELRIAPAEGHPGEFAVVAFDVSHWIEQQQKLTHEMHHDPLTGLDNLASARNEIEKVKREALANGTEVALLLVDIDEYHRVNQAFGYDAGDQILQETARRLQHTVNQGEFVARCDSDAFLILLTDIPNREFVEDVARRLADSILQPYSHEGQTLHISVSIGVVIFPDLKNNTDELLRQADQAVVRAKHNGGDRISFYEFRGSANGAETLKLESDLYSGVRNGEFSLHYQPITDVHTEEVVGVEALMRWQHPVHGSVPPSAFIPLAESAGLINFLGDWALKNTCMQLMQWDLQGIHLKYATVNVSAQQFRDKRFPAAVREAFKLTGIDPRRIVLEITETVLMHDPAYAKSLLEDLAALGVRFAVDDFGTGYSSLAYLQSFPLATLKIDRSFIINLPTSRNDQAIVAAVVGLANSLGLDLVAEGVETEDQRTMLAASGCNLIQGWIVCKALPIDELARKFKQGELRAQAS